MKEVVFVAEKNQEIERAALKNLIYESIQDEIPNLHKVLIIPPDYTRMYSGAGIITTILYELLRDQCSTIDILPALGTHVPVTHDECIAFFGQEVVDHCKIIEHNWRTDVVKIGQVPGEYVKEVSEGLVDTPIDVELNKALLEGGYDRVFSVGQVVPHEVIGMANYSKNIFVGCGGSSMINSSHMLGAFYGIERILGRDKTPVRRVFDRAEEMIADIPLMYLLTVTTQSGDRAAIHGLFAGRSRKLFEQACELSFDLNFTFVEKPPKKVVAYMDPREFKSTWIGNKAIYRSRMAIAEGGELIVLAKGVCMCGEDPTNDALIRKYGYVGREKVLELVKTQEDLQENLSVAAHLIHGSSDGRFSVTYCTEIMTKEEVESLNFKYMPYAEAVKKYNPSNLKEGWNEVDGEEIYFIPNPALGLWAHKDRFVD